MQHALTLMNIKLQHIGTAEAITATAHKLARISTPSSALTPLTPTSVSTTTTTPIAPVSSNPSPGGLLPSATPSNQQEFLSGRDTVPVPEPSSPGRNTWP